MPAGTPRERRGGEGLGRGRVSSKAVEMRRIPEKRSGGGIKAELCGVNSERCWVDACTVNARPLRLSRSPRGEKADHRGASAVTEAVTRRTQPRALSRWDSVQALPPRS